MGSNQANDGRSIDPSVFGACVMWRDASFTLLALGR